MRPSIVLGAFILVAILGFWSVEFVQRTRFEKLRAEIEDVVWSLDGAKLGRDATGITLLPAGAAGAEARYQAGLGYNLEEQDRWMMWSLTPKSLKGVELDENWAEARVIFMFRQARTVFLRSPRVSVIMLHPPNPRIAAQVDNLLKARGIDFNHLAGLP